MGYVKLIGTQEIEEIIPVGDEYEVPEHVNLGLVAMNYPATGEGWTPVYSTVTYATVAGTAAMPPIPPANEVDLAESQYLHDYVNHYWGAPRPE